jgi:spermidine/putrescine transport system permease protein
MHASKLSKKLIFSGVAVYLFLYLPLIILVVYSFNDSRVNVGWVGFTFKWYIKLFHDTQLMQAAINSLIIASIASTVSVILGTLAGVALHKYKVPFLSTLVMIPVAAPELLVGVALLLFFLMINFTLGMTSIILSHIAFCLSFVTISVKTRMHGMDESLVDAARDLGASPVKAFFLVLVPTILPGIIAGWLMAFTLSLDDFVITFFTSGVGSTTLPLAIYSMLKIGVTPEVNAISTIIILVTLVLTTAAAKLSKQRTN